MAKGIRWGPDITDQIVKLNALGFNDPEISEALGLQRRSVSRWRFRNGIKSQTPKGGQFMKGQKPHNCGIKFPHAPSHTQYKKGNLPHNTLYDGCERVRQDKNGKWYVHVRVGLGVWKLKSRVVWEAAHGQQPPKTCITFKNGNTLDCRPENLELITKAENLKRNRVGKQAGTASRELTDNYVISRILLKRADKEELRQLISQEMIAVKRNEILLKRLLKTNQDEPKRKNNGHVGQNLHVQS